MRLFQPLMIATLAALPSACVTSAPPATLASSGAMAEAPIAAAPSGHDAEPQSRASRIAAKLAQAEAAYEAGDRKVLADLVASLSASGVQSYGDAATDPLRMWQSASGAAPSPFRGRLLGPAYVRGELAPGEVWRSAQTFSSGEASTLSVSHKGQGPVRMTVSDAKAREVCTKGSLGQTPCRFTPIFTQRYEIELRNEGKERAVYFLVFD